jgi:hypothetical protein
MEKTLISATDAVFEDRKFFEYFLQRLRIIKRRNIPLFKVTEMFDLPQRIDPDWLPSIEIRLQMPGISLDNPATGKPLVSRQRIKACFEGPLMQAAFRQGFAKLIADGIPEGSPEYELKTKFDTLDEGRLGKLPPRADLKILYDNAKKHLRAIKAYFLENPTSARRELSQQNPQFLREAQQFFWWNLVERGDIGLDIIETKSPSSTALLVLMLFYGVTEETLKSRLYRR